MVPFPRQAFSPEVKAAARVPLSSDSDEGSPSPPPRRLPKGPATPHPKAKARPQKNASAKKGSRKGGAKKGAPSLLAALLLLAVTAAALLFGALHPEPLPAPLQPHARKLTPAARAALSSAEGFLAAAAVGAVAPEGGARRISTDRRRHGGVDGTHCRSGARGPCERPHRMIGHRPPPCPRPIDRG